MTDHTQHAPRAIEPANRARALGRELVEVHGWLRAELTRIREEIDTDPDGDIARLTPLRAHCTAFCLVLTRHHTNEDGTAFPALGKQFPELVPVLEQLRHDHVLVADILRKIQNLLTALTPGNVDQVRWELDGLAAILESHFRWEERRLADALNALDTPQASEELFGVQQE